MVGIFGSWFFTRSLRLKVCVGNLIIDDNGGGSKQKKSSIPNMFPKEFPIALTFIPYALPNFVHLSPI
jgi:hypothetical protein